MPELTVYEARPAQARFLSLTGLWLAGLWLAGLVALFASNPGSGPLLLILTLFDLALLSLEERLSRELGRQTSAVSSSTLLVYAGAFLISPAYLLLHALLRLSLNELLRPSANGYRLACLAAQVSLAWLPASLVIAVALRVLPMGAPTVLALSLAGLTVGETISERWIRPREAGVSGGLRLASARVASGAVGILLAYQVCLWDGPTGIALFGLVLAAFLGAATHVARQCQLAVELAVAETERRQAAAAAVQDRRRAVEKLAYSDTFIEGLGNRRRFERDLAATAGDDTLLVLGDVAGLKTVNDARGHPTGDLLLAAIGRALYAVSRERGRAYHFPGGDEYALLIDRFPRERIGAMLAEIDAQVAAEVSREPDLAGVRIWLRTGWAHGGPDSNRLRAAAEAMLTERGLAEKRVGLGGRA